MLGRTTIHRLFDNARQHPERPALHEKRHGGWAPIGWRGYAQLVRRAARSLLALGFAPGDTVSILGFNRLEWIVTDLATIAAGGAPAGIYTTSSSEEVAYIVGHAASRVVLVENAAQWAKLEPHLTSLSCVERVVLMRDAEAIEHPKVLRWEAFLALGDAVPEARLDERVEALEPSGLATLIYTSGTTGPPKAVMLSHDNLAYTADIVRGVIDANSDDVMLSYLPLSHVAEQVLSIHAPIALMGRVFIAESIERLPENLREVQPTIFFGVPRIWEKFHAGITAKLATATGSRARLAVLAQQVGRAHTALRNRGAKIPPHLRFAYEAMDRAVYAKLRAALGLGRVRRCISGAAPISRDVLEFFAGFGLNVQEVYGQSEDTGPATLNRYANTRLGTVGTALPGVELRIADDGEILVRGRTVFLGYYKDPAATAEALTPDRWLRSGDLGALDADGFLTITGRKKEIIITSGGKNITPVNIEQALKKHPIVSEAVVVGDRRKYLAALVAIDADVYARTVRERGWPDVPAHESDALRGEIDQIVSEVNRAFARVEQVKRVAVLPRPLSLEHGELTPTLKLKRRVIQQNWAALIDALYRDDGRDEA